MLTVHGLSKFRYELQASGQTRAVVRMPMRPAMARNAAFSLGANGYVEIDAGGTTYRVEYETFNQRALAPPDYRFFLMRGDATVATATQLPGRPRRWQVEAGDVRFRLVEHRRLLSMHFALEDGASGGIRETTRMLALRRRFEVDVPGDSALQAFVFFLAVNATYR